MPDRSASSGRRLDRAARRRQLIDIGYGLGRRMPMDQISAEEVASEAGVSKALVFHYFPTRIDLHVAILEAAVDELRRRLEPDVSHTPEVRLRTGLAAFASYVDDHRYTYQSLVRGTGVHHELLAVFERARGHVLQLLADGLGAEALSDPLLIALRGWLAMVEESLLHWMQLGEPIEQRHLLDLLYDTGVAIVPRAAVIPTLPR